MDTQIKQHIRVFGLGILALSLAGCNLPITPTPTLAPTSTPAPTVPPSPTATPAPTPTQTPIPSADLALLWPDSVGSLGAPPIEVVWSPPPGVEATAQISATILDPDGMVYATLALAERDGDHYRAAELLRFPLDPLPGFWWLSVQVSASIPTAGRSASYFEVESVTFRELEALPAGVRLNVPVDFDTVVSQGDAWAGGRVWTYAGSEVALWWAPGPTQELMLDTAIVALEAAYEADPYVRDPPILTEALPLTWQGRTAFKFPEVGPEGGVGRAWVIQGPDFWLYVLRIGSVEAEVLPELHLEVAQTFRFTTLE